MLSNNREPVTAGSYFFNSMPMLFSHTSQMPFGRYRGKQMKYVPAVYLLWLYDKGCTDKAIRQYVEMEYQRLTKEAGTKRIKA